MGGREAVDALVGLGLVGHLVGVPSHVQTTKVGDVLAKGEFAVDLVASHVELVEQFGELGGALVELLGVFLSPPVVEVAHFVVLAALVVEAVGHLVTYHYADATVVDGIVSVHVEERRLKDGGGEHDFVHFGTVVSVDGLGRHEPFFLVDGLAETRHVDGVLKSDIVVEILEIRLVRDVVVGVILPFVRVADFHVEGGKLGEGLGFGLVAHPFEVLDALAKGHAQVLDEVQHTLFGFGGEVLFDVELADGFAQAT